LAGSRVVRVGVAGFSAVALFVGFANDVFGLLPDKGAPPSAGPPAPIEAERRALLLANELAHQTAFGLHFTGEADTTRQIRWRAVLSIANTGAAPMVVEDIETRFAETADLRLVRTGQAETMTVFRDRADIIEVSGLAEDEQEEARFARSVDRPLLLQPGQRVIIDYEQAFELHRDGVARTFTRGDNLAEALSPLVPMRPLENGGLQCNLFVKVPTVVHTPNGEISKMISYAMLIAGCNLRLPSPEDLERLRETADDPLGDGFGG
jgi:hypothetical protein